MGFEQKPGVSLATFVPQNFQVDRDIVKIPRLALMPSKREEVELEPHWASHRNCGHIETHPCPPSIR